ncbi:MAG: YHS domain-containing (seleno)protein [Gemmobacter sp.]
MLIWASWQKSAQVVHRLGAVLAACWLSLGFAMAEPAVNMMPDGVAVDGFDVVAYFTESAPREGVAEHTVRYLDADWRFATAEHAALFAADPARYAPQGNGYCSFAVSEGYTAEVDVIDGWAVIDGKLYLNWDRAVRDQFVAEQAARVAAVAAKWPTVLAGLADGTTEFYPHSSDPSVTISHPQKLP